ncbi:uncharacterized protein LOC132624291 [Lycium barbarum]|uniref:uncharacterized protein LOC132624291 n=1 Tax=Lycium barbarum TaxID=112863 RepID=UPI00293E730A|nr:uncharacterized protein LOC132624291 [Lycium barbarum]
MAKRGRPRKDTLPTEQGCTVNISNVDRGKGVTANPQGHTVGKTPMQKGSATVASQNHVQLLRRETIETEITPIPMMNTSVPDSEKSIQRKEARSEVGNRKTPVEPEMKDTSQQATPTETVQPHEIPIGADEGKHKTPWTNLFSQNRVASKGMPLAYVAPTVVDGKPVVYVEEDEVKQQTQNWMNALVVYTMGDTPSYTFMSNYVARNWNTVACPEVYYHDEGYYIVKFQSPEDRDEIMFAGPYTMNSIPLVLQFWTPEFDFHEEYPRTMPLWVKFPTLPMIYWGPRTLGNIASRLGNPLFADECTAKQSRVSYARVLVDMDVTQELPREVQIVDFKGNSFRQDVVYEWCPKYCPKCLKYGHICADEIKRGPPAPHNKPKQRGKAHQKPYVQRWVGRQLHTSDPGPSTNTQQPIIAGTEQQQEINGTSPSMEPIQQPADKDRLAGHAQGGNRRGVTYASMVQPKALGGEKQQDGKPQTHMSKNQQGVSLIAPIHQVNTDGPTEAINGRIWILWKAADIQVTIEETHDQLILCHVQDRKTDFQSHIAVVYGKNTIEERKSLWAELARIGSIITTPWCICGDFNTPLSIEDRVGGQQVTQYETNDFRQMVDTLNLTDMKATGRVLTWTNGHVWSRIDRALCNPAWNLTYGRITADFKENNFSDHSPIHLAFSLDEARKRRPFRFLNVLTADERFLGIIDEVWKQPTQGSFMFQVWQKLTKCKEPLKVLMQAEMGNLEHKIQEARDRVQAIQIQLTKHIDETLLLQEKDAM